MNENEFLKSIFPKLNQKSDIIVGPGDDCAVIDIGDKDRYYLIAADQIISNVHFDPEIASPEEVGAKLIKRNISDIAAMGGYPAHAVVTIAAENYDLNWMHSFYNGLSQEANKWNISICGGDIAKLPIRAEEDCRPEMEERLQTVDRRWKKDYRLETEERLQTTDGRLQTRGCRAETKERLQTGDRRKTTDGRLVTRGCRAETEERLQTGDRRLEGSDGRREVKNHKLQASDQILEATKKFPIIATTLTITGFVDKQKLCLRQNATPNDIIFTTGKFGDSYKSRHHLKFTPRIKEAEFLAGKYTNTMIDVSDGLLMDIHRISTASGVSIELNTEFIPGRKKELKLKNILTDGEDYELIFTVKLNKLKSLLKEWPFKTNLSQIGKVLNFESGNQFCRILDSQGNNLIQQYNTAGYDHISP